MTYVIIGGLAGLIAAILSIAISKVLRIDRKKNAILFTVVFVASNSILSQLISNDLNTYLNKSKCEKALISIEVYAYMKDKDPKAFNELVGIMAKEMTKGTSHDEVVKKLSPLMDKYVLPKVPYSSNKSIINFTETVIEQCEKLLVIKPEYCFDTLVYRLSRLQSVPNPKF